MRIIAIVLIAMIFTGCGGRGANGATSPKAIADILFEGLKDDAFGKVADLVPLDETDQEAFVRQTSEEEEEYRNERKYNRQRWLKELELAFKSVRSKYGDEAWESAKIVGYDGIEDDERNRYSDFTEVYIFIEMDDRKETLKVGDMKKKGGRWYLVTEPEWD
jgi:hypothetical protein